MSMNSNSLKFRAFFVISALVLGGALFIRGCGRESEHQQNIPPVSVLGPPSLVTETANSPIQSQKTHHIPATVQEWIFWFRHEAKFRYDRKGDFERGVFTFEGKSFEKLGFSSEVSDEICSGIFSECNKILYWVWMRAPDKMHDDGVMSACEFEPFRDRGNRQRMEMMKEFSNQTAFNIKSAVGWNHDPEFTENLTEALVQILRQEPMTRDFDQGRFIAKFEDVALDGRRQFKVTEQILSPDGSVTWENQFISEELPQPYKWTLAAEP